MKLTQCIALDCDGVLLDYASACGLAWERAFGETPTLVRPHAYWPMDRCGVPRLSGDALARFREVIGDMFWENIPAIEGAVQACEQLVRSGYELMCVTSWGPRHLAVRMRNLQALGLPLSQVFANASHSPSGISPKVDVLDRPRPAGFVDDCAPWLVGVDAEIHKVLITRDSDGSPNPGPMSGLAVACFGDLQWCVSTC